jgi:hypothetical protein
MILRFHPRHTMEPNTFTAHVDGAILLVSAHVRRTDVSIPITLSLACWVAERDRNRPAYHRPLDELHRQSETVFVVPAYRFGRGDLEDLWLIDVPDVEANAWCAAGAHSAGSDSP